MKSAPIPANESERLEALASYRILDTPPEEEYEEIIRATAEISGTPIVTLSLLDENREWIKAKQGIEALEVPRALSFCAHAILEPRMLLVPDARYDDRFHDNPFTTGKPNVVFYAGVPVINDQGYPLGVLAVIDNRPRELSEQKFASLEAVAKLAASHFELRKLKMQLEEGMHSQQEVQQLLTPMLHAIEALLQNNPRKDQIALLNTLHKTACSLNQNQQKL